MIYQGKTSKVLPQMALSAHADWCFDLAAGEYLNLIRRFRCPITVLILTLPVPASNEMMDYLQQSKVVSLS